MVTHTPIPYWMSLPWADARAWAESVIEIHRETAGRD